MTALVTGGAGFVGSNLVAELIRQDRAVRVIDDLTTGRLENLEHLDVEVVHGSILDDDKLARAMAGVDMVFHQAAIPSVPRSLQDPEATHHAAATGTLRVLLAARHAGVQRVIYASSSSIYGETVELPKREEMTPAPISPYAAAKLAGETYCRAFTAAFGLETVALRYFNVFGPRQDPSGAYAAVIPRFINAVLDGSSPTIFGDGHQTRDFTFVGNVVSANLLASHAPPSAAGRVFNIASGHRVSLRELLEEVCAVVGKEVEPIYADPRPGDIRDSWADISDAQAHLGYVPTVSLGEGIRETVNWYASRGRPGSAGAEVATQHPDG